MAANAGENAAVACACYAAAAGIPARVTLSPDAHYIACTAYGARIGDAPDGRDAVRIEGLKTCAFEIAEQFEWELPDIVICRGEDERTALVKGFQEILEMGWAEGGQPRVINAEPVPLREVLDAAIEIARLEGIFATPQTGACIIALRQHLSAGWIDPSARTVIVNGASGLGYAGVFASRIPRIHLTEADKLGGLITPR
jgi:threonine synthase